MAHVVTTVQEERDNRWDKGASSQAEPGEVQVGYQKEFLHGKHCSHGKGFPERWWILHPWRCVRNDWTWHAELWDGLNDLGGVSQSKGFCDFTRIRLGI